MAIFVHPVEHTNLWNTEVKIPQRQNFKVRYFREVDICSSCNIFWRPRTEFSLSIHLPGKVRRKFFLRDQWTISHSRKPSAHAMGYLMSERYLIVRALGYTPPKDEEKNVKCCENDSLVSKRLLTYLEVKDKFCFKDKNMEFIKGSESWGISTERDQPVEEPWLFHSSLSHDAARSDSSGGLADENRILNCLSNDSQESTSRFLYSEDIVNAMGNSSDSSRLLAEQVCSVEEPWLLPSSLPFPSSNAEVVSDMTEVEIPVKDEASYIQSCTKHEPVQETLLTDTDGNIVSQETSVSTVILINSSICTMQRIAVLEDGKLVELLLEPVKNNVQCDSVYLGVVTKLVPHMGGAFVDIGSPRPSLMDIRAYREPFVFPPFSHHSKEKLRDGSVFAKLGENPNLVEDEHDLEDVEVIDEIDEHDTEDEFVEYMDDLGDHKTQDDLDISETFKHNLNGSLKGVEEESNFEIDSNQVDGNGEHLGGQGISRIHPVDVERSHLRPMHSQQIQDCKDACTDESKWAQVRQGSKIIVQVVKEGLGTKGPTLTAYPKLRSRFWVLITRCNTIGISKKISGVERTRLRVIAKTLQPQGFGLTVRTVAAGHSLEELQKDLQGLLSTWKDIMEQAKCAALAADEGVEGAIPVLLNKAMGQTLSVVQDYFNEKVNSMVVDSPRTYHEVTNYLQEIAPDLCDQVELYSKRTPLFDEYNIEEEISNMLGKRVPLVNGGYLVIEQTEALVSIDVNGGHCMLGQGNSQEKAILDVNLEAARQIARELRLRDIGGIIVVDFIDMADDSNKRLVYEEVKKAVERDRSMVKVSELSRHGLMEITRKRVRPSVTFMISEPCTCCHATGRVEALETSFSKIEREICRLLAIMDQKADAENPKSWPRFILRVDRYMCSYLTSGKRTRLAVLSSSLKVWILLKVARGFSRGAFELKPLVDDNCYNNQWQAPIPMLGTSNMGNSSRKVTVIPIKRWKIGRK